ncbi:MAG TPA: hypothetical protein PLN69_11685 [bacterium]|nr:hypothetical protein [bacterium]
MRSARYILLIAAVIGVVLAPSCANRTVKKSDKAWAVANRIRLTTEDEPWKLMEAVYAFGPRTVAVDPITQKRTQAIAFLASGAIRGMVKTDAYGAYFVDSVGDKKVELHRNNFLADMVSAGVDPAKAFVNDQKADSQISEFFRRATVKLDTDMLAQDDLITGPEGNELGWTLIALAHADMLMMAWVNENGYEIAVEDLLYIALKRPVNWGSYEGLIEQLGIAVALREYRRDLLIEDMARFEAMKKKSPKIKKPRPDLQGVDLKGMWVEVDTHVKNVIEILKKNQNEDGSFSASWYKSKEPPESAEELVTYTGHVLDFLDAALPDENLNDPWVKKTVAALSDTVMRNRYQLYDKTWELTHAAHALRNYGKRVEQAGRPLEGIAELEAETDSCCD